MFLKISLHSFLKPTLCLPEVLSQWLSLLVEPHSNPLLAEFWLIISSLIPSRWKWCGMTILRVLVYRKWPNGQSGSNLQFLIPRGIVTEISYYCDHNDRIPTWSKESVNTFIYCSACWQKWGLVQRIANLCLEYLKVNPYNKNMSSGKMWYQCLVSFWSLIQDIWSWRFCTDLSN